jgi:hypothetical protein
MSKLYKSLKLLTFLDQVMNEKRIDFFLVEGPGWSPGRYVYSFNFSILCFLTYTADCLIWTWSIRFLFLLSNIFVLRANYFW